ncbi:COG1361 S-layer family protein [Methanocella sp. MCL-LM]|uniref:COG1361 S-layer family protein n=1 Tax=Methanocella sp. MCL-LM TaxID=3412035 RepID=UPI003C73CAAF
MTRPSACFMLSICLVAILYPLATPAAQSQILGGPMIDACIYGSRELYPGQIVTLQLLVQNSGYIQAVAGYDTPDAWLQYSGGASYSAVVNGASSKTLYDSSEYQIASAGLTAGAGSLQTGLGSIGGSASASHTSLSQSTSSSSYQFSQIGAFGNLQINSAPGVEAGVTTALGITCDLSPGDAPIEIVSDNRMVLGSLPAGAVTAPVPYLVRVSRDAQPGHYKLPLLITYKRLAEDYDYTSFFGQMYGYSNYVEESCIIYLDIVIMGIFDLIVTDITAVDMVPGTNGIVSVRVTHVGTLPVEHAIVYLTSPTIGPCQDSFYYPVNYQLANYQTTAAQQPVAVDQNMLVPVQNSQYLGHMEPGEDRVVKFKLSVADDAEDSDFPVSAVVSYEDPWGTEKSSNVETFGAHVEKQMRFTVDDEPVKIKCGRSTISTLTLTNNGTIDARDAIVRMNALDPFTVSYDTMYLGDVRPGENTTTQFGIKVKPDAVPGTYYVTLEVKYYDSQDDPHVTKIIRKAITVDPPPTLWETILENWLLVLGLIILLIAGLLYAGYRWMKKRQSPDAGVDADASTGVDAAASTGVDADTDAEVSVADGDNIK